MTSHRPNVLYLTHRVPHPPNRGDRIRSWHTLRTLAERADVWLACTADDKPSETSQGVLTEITKGLQFEPLSRLQRWSNAMLSVVGGRTATVGLFASGSLRSRIRGWAQEVEFDSVLVLCSSMFQYTQVPELRNVPTVVDLIDVDSEKWLECAKTCRSLKAPLYALEGRRLRRLETELGQRARAVTLVSEAEADIYRRFAPSANTHAVPNGVDTEYFRPDHAVREEDRRDCVFVGVLDYPPNVEGVLWFADHVWPAVHERHPDSRFVVVGLRPAKSIRSLADRPGIEVAADVPDVRPHLRAAAVAVAPLQQARGVQNKVLEAMACGRPVVATPAALTGLNVAVGTDVIEAVDDVAWINSLSELLGDPMSRTACGTAARALVERYHEWTTCIAPLVDLLATRDRSPRMEPAAR